MKGARWAIVLIPALATLLGMSGCSSDDLPTPMAPVVNGWTDPTMKQGPYIVQPGDTLYSIAWAYGIDYHDIIRMNHLKAPYSLQVGQKLYMAPPASTTTASASGNQVAATSAHTKQTTTTSQATTHGQHQSGVKTQVTSTNTSHDGWQWPVVGTVVQSYNAQNALSRGIDIRTSPNAKVHAVRAGEVVYAGHGIPSYGNLIIIKHGSEFLSAYGYNAKNLVHEGDKVKAGQVIATVQGTPTKPNVLHFEIRDRGQPVNPLTFLPKQSH